MNAKTGHVKGLLQSGIFESFGQGMGKKRPSRMGPGSKHGGHTPSGTKSRHRGPRRWWKTRAAALRSERRAHRELGPSARAHPQQGRGRPPLRLGARHHRLLSRRVAVSRVPPPEAVGGEVSDAKRNSRRRSNAIRERPNPGRAECASGSNDEPRTGCSGGSQFRSAVSLSKWLGFRFVAP